MLHISPLHRTRTLNSLPCYATSRKSDSEPDLIARSNPKPKYRSRKAETSEHEGEEPGETFPATIPRKPRRGRRSEAAAVEDYVRESLDRTFASTREQNPEIVEKKDEVMKRKVDDGEEEEGFGREKSMVVEEESKDWPLDADEINCLEWESFAFHPSPLLVLVFERYNRASENWKALKELEKAVKVYWNAKDRLPPRLVKIDINIERDLAYALKVRDCPQFCLYEETGSCTERKVGSGLVCSDEFLSVVCKNYHIFLVLCFAFAEIRTAEELVPMIAHFYYNAKRPSWIDANELSSPC
ncbi:hypothetical protein DVH24_010566 [Malus domestica]|uniref:Thioredoxin domain-containing protein n=1 Tax=Malus domestica TaxID=3750 RepID=A0A498JYJ5_MALDO|nr:hypothetical protein DVH24_010566 [Malus domestica]